MNGSGSGHIVVLKVWPRFDAVCAVGGRSDDVRGHGIDNECVSVSSLYRYCEFKVKHVAPLGLVKIHSMRI